MPAAPAAAESFFDKLMDLVVAAPAEERREPVPSLRDFQRTSPYGGYGADDYSTPSYQSTAPTGTTVYRTLCVRMCDGYYWPVSASVGRGRLYHDADVCRSSCDTEARLFFLPRGSDDVEHMTDISGRVYGRLPEAFLYRKSLVAGCTCRADPWSESEVNRHRAYAEIEAAKARGEIPAAVADARIAAQGARPNPGAPIETGAVSHSGSPAATTSWSSASPPPELPPKPQRRATSDFDFLSWW